MLVPREYQDFAVKALFDFFTQHRTGNPLVLLPTGTGKSVVIAEFLRRVYLSYPRQRIMMVTDSKELIGQNFEKLLDAWPTAPAGIYSAGLKRKDTQQKIIFAGIGSVAKRPEDFGHVDILFVDECHMISHKDLTMYRAFIAALLKVNPYLRVVGLTATPWRMGYGKIWEGEDTLFTHVAVDAIGMHAFNWFVEQGYLIPLVPKRTDFRLDTKGVQTSGGEFVQSQLQAALDKKDVTTQACREAVSLGEGRFSWLVFCAGVEHAEHVAETLTELGVPCKAVTSKTPAEARDQILKDFKSGKLKAVANNGVLTKGFDHPALDFIVILRPTKSSILWVQILGRGTRPCYAKGFDLSTLQGRLDAIQASHKTDCLVADFAHNSEALGPINDPVLPRKRGEGPPGEAPIKVCGVCSTYNHASATECLMCGTPFPKWGPKVHAEASEAVLVKQDVPKEVAVFKVDHVTYSRHDKVGSPPSLKASYFCGVRRFQEYIALERAEPYIRRQCGNWWLERAVDRSTAPDTVHEALKRVHLLRPPTHLRVHVNARFPVILQQCFDGTAFGTIEEADALPPPDIDVDSTSSDIMNAPPAPPRPTSKVLPGFEDFDDDIPF